MEIRKIKLVLLAIAVVTLMGSAVPAMAAPYGPDQCNAWYQSWLWYPSGWWGHWYQWCNDPYNGWYINWDGWNGPY